MDTFSCLNIWSKCSNYSILIVWALSRNENWWNFSSKFEQLIKIKMLRFSIPPSLVLFETIFHRTDPISPKIKLGWFIDLRTDAEAQLSDHTDGTKQPKQSKLHSSDILINCQPSRTVCCNFVGTNLSQVAFQWIVIRHAASCREISENKLKLHAAYR